MLDTHGRKYLNSLFQNLAKILLSLNLKPLHITFAALIIGLIAAFCFYIGFHISSLILLWTSGLLDALDGEMARQNKSKSNKGALLDLLFDRIVEIAFIFSFVETASTLSLLTLSCTIILSMTLFLSVGAMSNKQSKKSFYYQAGLVERTEAFILFSLMIIFSSYSTYIAYIFSILILITIFQRLKEALEILK